MYSIRIKNSAGIPILDQDYSTLRVVERGTVSSPLTRAAAVALQAKGMLYLKPTTPGASIYIADTYDNTTGLGTWYDMYATSGTIDYIIFQDAQTYRQYINHFGLKILRADAPTLAFTDELDFPRLIATLTTYASSAYSFSLPANKPHCQKYIPYSVFGLVALDTATNDQNRDYLTFSQNFNGTTLNFNYTRRSMHWAYSSGSVAYYPLTKQIHVIEV